MKNYGDWFRQKDRIIKTKATELMLDSFVYSQLDKRQNEQNVQNDRVCLLNSTRQQTLLLPRSG